MSFTFIHEVAVTSNKAAIKRYTITLTFFFYPNTLTNNKVKLLPILKNFGTIGMIVALDCGLQVSKSLKRKIRAYPKIK